MAKRTVNVREIVADVRAGLDDSALIEKYRLSEKGLHTVFKKLADVGALKREDLDSRLSRHDNTLETIWRCPACGKPQTRPYEECPDCGVIVVKLRNAPEDSELAGGPQRNALATSGIDVSTLWKCPACGMPQFKPFAECPQCGAIVSNYTRNRKEPTSHPTRPKKSRVVEQTQVIISDLSKISFSQEIIPVDETNIGALKTDFVFLAVSFLGVVPLIIGTLEDNTSQITAFALFFAFVWGAIFKKLVVKDSGGWKLPVAALFFSGTMGIFLLFTTYALLPVFYLSLHTSRSSLGSLIGFVFQVGIWEELCKILPVLGFLYWHKRKKRVIEPASLVVIGIFSGLGFAAFENMGYANLAVLRSVALAGTYGALGLREGVSEAMINHLVRSLSLVFCHAVWTGIFSYFVAMAVATGRRLAALFLVGLAVSASLHGFYDWLCGTQLTVAALTAGFSFMLFYAYNSKLLLLVRDEIPCQGGSTG